MRKFALNNFCSLKSMQCSCPSVWSLVRCFFIVICWLLSISISAQDTPHPSFRQYTTEDGLASPETYHILQDKVGYIWIATDNGISRFDGYNFHNYGFQEGLKENVIFLMQFDTIGRLWAQAKSGNLYYLEDQVFHAYKYNVLLKDFPGRPQNGRGFIVEGAGETVHISTLKYGLITIYGEGKVLTYSHDEPIYHQVFTKNGITIYSKFIADEKEIENHVKNYLPDQKIYYPAYFYFENEIWEFCNLDDSQIQRYNAPALSIGKGKFLFQIYENVWLIENGEVKGVKKFPTKFTIAQIMENDQLLIGLHGHKGLAVYKSLEAFQDGKGSVQLIGKTVNNFTVDKEDGRWFATHEDGIFYVPSGAFPIYDKETGLTDEKITAITSGNDADVYIGLENGEVWYLNPKDGILERMANVPGTSAIKDIIFDFKTNQLWVARDRLCYLHDGEWKVFLTPKSEQTVKAYRITASPNQHRFWIGNFESAMKINLESKIIDTLYLSADQQSYSIIEDFNGRVWIGKADGLFEWQNDSLISRQHLNPNFSLRIEDIALMPDSTLVLATKGGGLVFWKNEKFEQITSRQELTSNMMECVVADNKGIVWAGTLNGFNRISGSFGNRKVDQITVSHGLPSNQINRICTSEDAVWIATNKGLVQYVDQKMSHGSPKPILATLKANNVPRDVNDALILSAENNNLSIDFFTINYKMNGKIPYRFRMNDDQWTNTDNRSVNFPSLSPGKCIFEVQSQNEDGNWSESTTLQFEIEPPWWNTWWARSVAILSSLLLVLGIYKYRTGRVKKDAKIQIQMIELERSALQAQMNPHFIFNCLNSIQNFILQNEKDSAILYLGRFSSLVRSVLNASVSGNISLGDEIKLLNNYLGLEKLRFKNRFDFEVSITDGLDVNEWEIPPLLIQPYVENAILHGISKKKEGGKVDILFEKEENYIKVTIVDNGVGYLTENDNNKKKRGHKSFGMSITKDRLGLFSTGKENNLVTTNILYDDFGNISGTKVVVRVGIAD